MLFIDADTYLPSTAEAYMLGWIPMMNTYRVICGGILYHDAPPGDPDNLLRWKYGKWKEQKRASERNKNPYAWFSTFNVLLSRDIFSKIRFNEELKQYGYEDRLMGYQLKKAGIDILHIDNGLFHEGLETNKEFINKTKLGIENLSWLYNNVTDKRSFSKTVRVLKTYNWLKFFRITRILAWIFIRFRERLEIRIEAGKHSLLWFRIFKVALFCTFREIHRRKKANPVF